MTPSQGKQAQHHHECFIQGGPKTALLSRYDGPHFTTKDSMVQRWGNNPRMQSAQASSPRYLLCILNLLKHLLQASLLPPHWWIMVVSVSASWDCDVSKGKAISKSQVLKFKSPNSSYYIHGQITQSTGGKHTADISEIYLSPGCFIWFCQNGLHIGQAYTCA